MSRADADATIRKMAAHGIKGVLPEDWNSTLALDIIREQRRRYANEPMMQALGRVGSRLAKELAEQSGVALADVVTVLLLTAGKLGSINILDGGIPGTTLMEIMNCAADDLDRQAKAGEQL